MAWVLLFEMVLPETVIEERLFPCRYTPWELLLSIRLPFTRKWLILLVPDVTWYI